VAYGVARRNSSLAEPFGGAAGPGAGGAPCEPPCLKEQAVWLTGPLGVVLAGFHVVCVDGQGLLWRRFRFAAGGRSRLPV
jgi:hypothetical protein